MTIFDPQPQRAEATDLILDSELQKCGCEKLTLTNGKIKWNPCELHEAFVTYQLQMEKAVGMIQMLRQMVAALTILDNGCPKHRNYRARRKPIADCELCKELYGVRSMLNAYERNQSQDEDAPALLPDEYQGGPVAHDLAAKAAQTIRKGLGQDDDQEPTQSE